LSARTWQSRVIIVTNPGAVTGARLNKDAMTFAHEFPQR
jgi:hypothetical protein